MAEWRTVRDNKHNITQKYWENSNPWPVVTVMAACKLFERLYIRTVILKLKY